LFAQVYVNNEVLLNSASESKYSTFNVEVQDNLQTGIHNFNFGVNFRQVGFQVGPFDDASGIQFANPNSTEYLGGAFIQDKLAINDKFDVLLGVKGEVWSLIDNKPEWSPSVRFAYKPKSNLTIWGAGSRAVTTPGFIQTNIDVTFAEAIPGILPYRLAIINGPNTDQSEYWTYELGVKGGGSNFTYEVSAFYVDANNLIGTVTDGTPTPSPVNALDTVTPIYYANVLNTTNTGAEVLLKYKPSTKLSFEVSYAMIQIDYQDGTHPITGEVVTNADPEVAEIPTHVVRGRAYLDFKRDIRLSINGSFWTKTGDNEFIYDEQRTSNAAAAGEEGLILDEATSRFRLDFKLAKRFGDGKSSAYIWGTDIFNTGYIQNYQVYATGIPYQIHGMYGVGMQYDF
jgi:outer membrane receptor for ferrienterochelin and colicin